MARSTTLALAALLLAAFAIPACEGDPARPAPIQETPPPEPEGFLPLTVGSSWEYALKFTYDILDVDGRPVTPRLTYNSTSVRALVAIDTIAGREYVVEEQRIFGSDITDTLVYWRRFRQDDSGFYRAAIRLDIAPGTLPPLLQVPEYQRLLYPLEVGAHWPLLKGDRTVTHLVDGLDTLAVGTGDEPCFRISAVVADAGPDDYHYRWFSPTGFLGRADHLEIDALDLATNQRVHVITHETELLVRADIVRPRQSYVSER